MAFQGGQAEYVRVPLGECSKIGQNSFKICIIYFFNIVFAMVLEHLASYEIPHITPNLWTLLIKFGLVLWN